MPASPSGSLHLPLFRVLALICMLSTLRPQRDAFAADASGKLRFDLTGAAFTETHQGLMAEAKKQLDIILAVKDARSIENTLVPYNEMLIALDAAAAAASLFSSVHPDKKVVDAANAAEQAGSKFASELSLNQDLYRALAAVDAKNAPPETKRFLEMQLQDFRRQGVDKDEGVRNQLKQLDVEMTKLSQEFSNNLAADVRSILVSPAQLNGLPPDFIAAKKPGRDGRVSITTDYPDYFPFLKYAENAELRKKLYIAGRSRGYPQNAAVLKTIVKKRHDKAVLLGYKDYASYATENQMIKSPKRAQDFIDKVSSAVASRSRYELNQVLGEKRRLVTNATRVEDHEYAFYQEKLKQREAELDSAELRKYFAYEQVKAGLFSIVQNMFGVTFVQVKDAKLWHSDVEAWEMHEGGKAVGKFYLDLFPRENKYKHAAQFGLRSGVKDRQLPEGVLVCNFPNPREAKDALMEHSDVETFFHEFGHLLHALFQSKHEWIGNTGVRQWDFVEAPSQIYEEWANSYESLKLFAKHSKTGKVIPKALAEKMKKAKRMGVGVRTRQQMFYAALSLNLYQQAPQGLNPERLTKDMQAKYSPFPHVEGTHFAYNFDHLVGYSSNYYTYMWSEAIAKDMYSRFLKEGIFNPAVAKSYRDTVLSPGSAKDADELIRDFLGRPLQFQAFENYVNGR